MFFLKITTYQSTPKILYVLKGTKEGNQGTEEKPKREPKLPSLVNFSQQLIHQNQPLWDIICDDDTASLRFWQRSCMGA
jgi:hypothetical protein